jgi:hypothetical protein
MFSLLLSYLIISTQPNQPTEIIGTANTPSGNQKEIIVNQPNNNTNPFGNIATTSPTIQQPSTQEQPLPSQSTPPQTPQHLNTITQQTSTISPTDMNPLDYKNKIENTIYQSGDRLIIIQSIPIKYIKEATTPNIQPTISDFPSW